MECDPGSDCHCLLISETSQNSLLTVFKKITLIPIALDQPLLAHKYWKFGLFCSPTKKTPTFFFKLLSLEVVVVRIYININQFC